jgi:hypothetical protein
MLLTAFPDLVAALRAESIAVTVHDGAIVELGLTTGEVICLRWDGSVPVVQIVAALYTGVRPDVVPLVTQTVARLNHELPVPGLGFDEGALIVYFRTVVPRGPTGVWLEPLDLALGLVVKTIRGVRPALDDVMGPPPSPEVARDAFRALQDIGAYLAA